MSDRQIEDILESITDAFYAVDHQWRFTYINERALHLLQWAKDEDLTREELLGQNMWEVFPEAVSTVFYDLYHQAMRERKVVDLEEYYPPNDLWVEVHVYPYEDGLAFYWRDITQRKRAEEQLRYHSYLLENTYDAFIATDERLLVRAWNRGAERMYGWRADEALGRDAREAVSLEMSDEELAEAPPGDRADGSAARRAAPSPQGRYAHPCRLAHHRHARRAGRDYRLLGHQP